MNATFMQSDFKPWPIKDLSSYASVTYRIEGRLGHVLVILLLCAALIVRVVCVAPPLPIRPRIARRLHRI